MIICPLCAIFLILFLPLNGRSLTIYRTRSKINCGFYWFNENVSSQDFRRHNSISTLRYVARRHFLSLITFLLFLASIARNSSLAIKQLNIF